MSKTYFEPVDASLWYGRAEAVPQQRIYQVVDVINDKFRDFVSLDRALCFLGFSTDEGVIRNQGRPGAHAGPNAIRKILGNYTFHPISQILDQKLYDLGNVVVEANDLEACQQACAEIINEIHKKKGTSLILGGGHEIAWAHYLGLKTRHQSNDFAIINFDAHFDMRPLVNGAGNSGTSFLQIAQHRQTLGKPFHYYCVGVQPHSNTKSIYETAKAWQVQYLSCEEIYAKPLMLESWIDRILAQHKSIYLTVCMDVFSASVAPGVSASSPHGLLPWQVLPIIETLARSNQVIAMDVAEYAPNLDFQNITGKLAAMLIATYLNAYYH